MLFFIKKLYEGLTPLKRTKKYGIIKLKYNPLFYFNSIIRLFLSFSIWRSFERIRKNL